MRATKYAVTGYGSAERVVGDAGNSGRVHVPKSWRERRVMIVLLEPPDEPAPKKE